MDCPLWVFRAQFEQKHQNHITMQVKPITINLNTAEQQASHFFNREFNALDHFDMLKGEDGILNIMEPSGEILVKEYAEDSYSFDLAEELREYNEENDTILTESDYHNDDDFVEYVTNLDEFDTWKYEREHYPMWNAVWNCSDFYIDSQYCDVDKLYDLGIGVIDHESGYYLFIAGAGYSFYDAHWIPLFKMLGWIEEVEETVNA